MDRQTPRTRRGFAAVEAVIDEAAVRDRTDETDPATTRPGDYDLRGAAALTGDRARHAAAADVYTADEALDDVAGSVGIEVSDVDEDEHERP